MSAPNTLPCGVCNQTHVINGVTFEDRTYDVSDSTFVRALAYTQSKTIENGSVTTLEDVKTKRRLYREELIVDFQSEATGGKSAEECGPFDPQDARREVEESWISPQHMYIELSLCYKKLVKSWKQSQLKRGAARSEDDTSMNDWVLQSILKGSNKSIDKLIWQGDYKSADTSIAHHDGFQKKIFNKLGTIEYHTEEWSFSGILAGDHIEGRVGGTDIDIAFSTSNDVTVDDLVTALAALTDNEGVALFTVSNPTAPVVRLVNAKGNTENDAEFYVTDGTGVDYLCNAANTAGAGAVAYTLVTDIQGNVIPIAIPWVTLTKGNILDQLELLYTTVNSTNSDIWDLDPDLHISTHAAGLLNAALTDKGVGALADLYRDFGKKTAPFGFNIVPNNNIANDALILFDSKNAFWGTDLISDMNEVEMWVDKKCQTVDFRLEMKAGVGIGNYGEVACNFDGAGFVYNAAEPVV